MSSTGTNDAATRNKTGPALTIPPAGGASPVTVEVKEVTYGNAVSPGDAEE